MNLLEIGFAVDLDGSAGLRRDIIFESASGLEMAELFCDEVGDLVVSDVAGGGDEKVIGREPFLETIVENCGRKLFDGVRCAENRAAKRMLGPESTSERFVEKIFRVVHVHLDFFEDNLLFILDVRGIEARMETEIADDVESDGKILIENFGVETDLFF